MNTNIWTAEGYKARSNEYQGHCVACGGVVAAREGRLVAKPAATGGAPLVNGVVHDRFGCKPSDKGYFFRARLAYGKSIDEVRAELGEVTAFVTASAEPAAQPEAQIIEPTADELQQAAQSIVDKTTAKFLEEVPSLVRATLLELTRTVEIKVGKAPAVTIKNSHKMLPDIVMCVAAGTHPFLVGPAGSGKTTLARQVCDTLKRKFYAENRVTSEYKLLGYMDATGKYVRTQFREAYEKGGGFLLDEVDASDPDVLTTFNSALANGVCPFPDKLVEAHKDFFAIAAGNTFGRGADRQYVGRNQLDAATLDRFVIVEIDYDEVAELTWAANDDWTMYVQQVRKAIADENVRHIVSPRASIYGARLLAAGMDRKLVEERCIWKGLDVTNRARVAGRL